MSSNDQGTNRLQNLRDVGGLPLEGGGRSRAGVLYRSDAPWLDDVEPDLEWPPKTVLDLRSAAELRDGEHPLAHAGAQVMRLPLTSDASVDHLLEALGSELDALGQLYLGMLVERGQVFAQAAAVVAEAPGPILVHCAAGKDRTGALVAVLLLAVGVEEEAMVADYVLTASRMPGVLERLAADPVAGGSEQLRRIMHERPELLGVSEPGMRAVAAQLHARGGAGTWLVEHGLQERQLALLRTRLAGGP